MKGNESKLREIKKFKINLILQNIEFVLFILLYLF